MFDKILRLPVSLADRLQTGDVINRIQYDIDTVNASLSYDILQAATSVMTESIADDTNGNLLLFGYTCPAVAGHIHSQRYR